MSTRLITVATKAEAQALADKVHAWLLANVKGYQADRWDVPRQNQKDGTWAICYPEYAAAAFSSAERGDTTQKDAMGQNFTTYANVADFGADWEKPATVKQAESVDVKGK